MTREFLAYLELKRRNPMEGYIMGLKKILEYLQQAEKGVTQLLERDLTTDIREAIAEYTFSPGQKLMMDWTELLKNFTPYDAGVSKEAWDTWHTRLKQQTSQFLLEEREESDPFLPQVISLQLTVDEWLTEGESILAYRRGAK